MASLFPPGTFRRDEAVDLSFVCREDNPVRGGGAIRSAVVKSAGTQVTDAMRQWAILGWYELPAFAAMRARCCPDPAPLVIPAHPESCGAVGEALEGLAAATADPASSDAARTDALAAYTASVTCLTKARAHKGFGQPGGPDGGASTAFRTMMTKISGAAACDAAEH